MNVVKEEQPEDDKAQILIIGVADNSFKGPAECIKHVLNELRKAGHEVQIYTYHPEEGPRLDELLVFGVEELGLTQGWRPLTRAEVTADVYFDDKNFGNDTDWFSLFGAFLKSELIARTQRNGKLLSDFNFWQTGKEGSVLDLEKKIVPKIILPGQSN